MAQSLDDEDLHNRFSFHPATETTGPKHDRIRRILESTAEMVVDLTPAGREQALAVTKLEEAMMWANAAIARHGE